MPKCRKAERDLRRLIAGLQKAYFRTNDKEDAGRPFILRRGMDGRFVFADLTLERDRKFMSRIEKGDYGYFRNQRQKKLIIMVLLYAMTLVMYFGAKAYFGTNRNLFTILAVLVVLPAAKYTVQFIMLVRAGECSSGVRDEVEQHIGHLSGAYDLYFTSEKKNYNICHLAVSGGSIAAYTEDPKCDCRAGEQHLRRMMTGNGIHGYQIRIFTDFSSYLNRLDQLNELEAANGGAQEKLLQFFYQISL